jgi:hypothetical protein
MAETTQFLMDRSRLAACIAAGLLEQIGLPRQHKYLMGTRTTTAANAISAVLTSGEIVASMNSNH